MIKAYDRNQKKYIEVPHYGGSSLKKIYRSKLLTFIATSHLVSIIYGIYTKCPFSKKMIDSFIKDNNINMNLYEKKEYKSFNDFFIRKLKKINIDKDKNALISPCCSKLLAYKIDNNLKINIKNHTYTLDELFDKEKLDNFKDGYVLVYRLSVDDYHRFHYIDDGICIKNKKIRGKLHTVSDSSKEYKIYKENYREYSILKTKNFGEIIFMEVGAMLIGKIVNHNKDIFKKGEEKGYFLPGGSTVVVVIKNVKIDKDILNNSKKLIETIVTVGEKVGEKI